MHFIHEPMSNVFDKFIVDGMPCAAVLHKFSAPDHGDPHDHPWNFHSFIAFGGYAEEVFNLDGSSQIIRHEVGTSFYVPAERIHRIVELFAPECWTFVLPGQAHGGKSGFYQFREDGAYHRPHDRQDFWKLTPA